MQIALISFSTLLIGYVQRSCEHKKPYLDQLRAEVARQSSSFPRKLDDSVLALGMDVNPGLVTYRFQLVDETVDQIDVPERSRIAFNGIRKHACSTLGVRDLVLDHDLTARFSYVDRKGVFVMNIDVKLADCGGDA